LDHDRGLQGDDVTALFESVRDFVVDHDRGVSKISHASRSVISGREFIDGDPVERVT
jgi:hypothetical protein